MYNAWHKELEHVQQHMLATFSVVLFLPAGDKKSQKKKFACAITLSPYTIK